MRPREAPTIRRSATGRHLAYVFRAEPARNAKVPALFVDRDGVLNERQVGGYVLHPNQLVPLDGAVPTLVRASEQDIPVVIITNQGCLSRQLIDTRTLEEIHERLVHHLSERGVDLAAIYVCPHHPAAIEPSDRLCVCRKPKPGLLRAAAADLGLDLPKSVFVGDQETDGAASEAAGIPAEHFFLVDPARMARTDTIRLADGVMAALRRTQH